MQKIVAGTHKIYRRILGLDAKGRKVGIHSGHKMTDWRMCAP
jgi:hypothetical protein